MRLVPIAVVALMLTASAHGATRAMPDRHRFTGWMAVPAGGPPSHLVVDGDGATLNFYDRWNLTKVSVDYRACIVRIGHGSVGCRTSVAPASDRQSVLRMFAKCCGAFVASWYVGGRRVATWPFRFIPETS